MDRQLSPRERRVLRKIAMHKMAQEGKCPYCKVPLNVGKLTFDHVTPKSFSKGLDWNKLLCHYGCNMRKRNRLPSEKELVFLNETNKQLKGYHNWT